MFRKSLQIGFFSLFMISFQTRGSAEIEIRSEWKLKVTAAQASIYQDADENSPVVATVKQGDILQAYERSGAWFKVISKPDEKRFMSTGFIHSSDVEILEEIISQTPEYGEDEPEDFKGIGLSIKLSAGALLAAWGDMADGPQGIFDKTEAEAEALGYFTEGEYESINFLYEFGGAIAFRLQSNMEIEIGTGQIYGKKINLVPFYNPAFDLASHISTDFSVSAIPLRLGLRYSIPVKDKIYLSLLGGTALYLAKYQYGISHPIMPIEILTQEASARSLGFHGAVGLEFRLNQQASFLLECQGRYAKIKGFEGTSYASRWVMAEQISIQRDGKLYYIEENSIPGLTFSEGSPSGYQTASEAVFDLSGIGIVAGIIIRF